MKKESKSIKTSHLGGIGYLYVGATTIASTLYLAQQASNHIGIIAGWAVLGLACASVLTLLKEINNATE